METTDTNARFELGDSLVGRDAEQAELRSWLESSGRLLTLTGPPGVGKTSLGRCCANQARASGVNVLALSLRHASNPDEVYAELARSMEVALPAGVDMDAALACALEELGPCLLWLDDLRGSAVGILSLVRDWFDACPELRVLVTSQERLRFAEERVHIVRPLEIPTVGKATLESPAIAMWVERVRRFSRGYHPDQAELQVIAEIVRRLDGLPLAIELAAGRMELLDAAQILARIEREAAPKTLRSAIRWAWSYLDELEASALAQCSIFDGGFTAEAAEAVLEFSPEGAEALDTLQALRDKSLLRIDSNAHSGRRLELFHAVQELGRAQLHAQGTFESVSARHAAYYEAFALRLRAQPNTEASFRALVAERENLLSVVRRWLDDESREAEVAGAACLMALERIFWAYGYHDEPNLLLERAVAAADALPVDTQAELWRMRAGGLRRAGQHPQAVAAYEVALGLLAADDQARAAGILGEVSSGLAEVGQLEGAQAALQRALDLAPSDEVRAPLRVRMGDLLHEAGELDEAARSLADALETYRRTEDVVGELTASINLGNVLASRGAYVEAAARFDHVHTLAQETGHDYLASYADLGAALTAHVAANFSTAREAYEQARAELRRVRATRDEGVCLAYLAWLDFEEGHTELAAERADEALRMVESSGNVRYSALVRGRLAVIEAALGWRDAAATDMERALESIDRSQDPCLGAAVALHALHARLLLASGSLATRARAEAKRQLALTRVLAKSSSEVRLASRPLEAALEESSSEPGAEDAAEDQVLRVGPEASWFALGNGPLVNLTRRGAQRRLLHCLVLARKADTRSPLSVYELFDAGWPGQTISPEHSANRVYNALFELRKHGLRRAILRHDDGYLLDPMLPLEEEETPTTQ